MDMGTIQFYQNRYRYPHFSLVITPYGGSLPCTPVGMNLRSGTLRVEGQFTDFMSCNYMRFSRDGQTLYAWVDNVVFKNESVFEITYTVDAWRTFKNKVTLGSQFIARRPEPTTKRDNLLGSQYDYPDIKSYRSTIGDPTKRVFVVQVRGAGDEPFSRSPVIPSPYQFFMREYSVNNWTADVPINQLMSAVMGAQTENIVTMYSIPYMDIYGLPDMDLPVKTGSGAQLISGFKFLNDIDPSALLKTDVPITIPEINKEELLRVNHLVQVVIPEAGIITIPDELLMKSNLKLRQDVDLYSGACNYMLVDGDTGELFTQSVRGGSVSSIPIVSDPLDTYLSQNQNALFTAMVGDVASIAIGSAAMMSGGGVVAGAGAITGLLGGSSVISGVNNIVNRGAQQADMANARPSNPPAFLGTAMANNFNKQFWVVVSQLKAHNAETVHRNFGYPWGMVDALTFPESGFIQTEGCNVISTNGDVPRWALDEINNNFNSGILVH